MYFKWLVHRTANKSKKRAVKLQSRSPANYDSQTVASCQQVHLNTEWLICRIDTYWDSIFFVIVRRRSSFSDQQRLFVVAVILLLKLRFCAFSQNILEIMMHLRFSVLPPADAHSMHVTLFSLPLLPFCSRCLTTDCLIDAKEMQSA